MADLREVFPESNGLYGFPNELIDRELEMEATIRNWNTVGRIARRLSD